MVMHHDHNHVVRVDFGLLAIVREDILEDVWGEDRRKVNSLVGMLTFDQVTKSFVASSKLWMIGCSITSSGRSKPPAYSIKAQQGLQPEVSLRTAMYSSRPGMMPAALSRAWIVTALKKRSMVCTNRF